MSHKRAHNFLTTLEKMRLSPTLSWHLFEFLFGVQLPGVLTLFKLFQGDFVGECLLWTNPWNTEGY